MKNNKHQTSRLLIQHLLFIVFLTEVLFIPKEKPLLKPCSALLIAAIIAEIIFIIKAVKDIRKQGFIGTGATDISSILWLFMAFWELMTSILDKAHPVLVPAPENVFYTFVEQWRIMLLNISYSMELLIGGMITALVLAVALGLFCGWNERLKAFAYPIANVMAPIPAIVISPFLVAIMPSFRSASLLVVILGVFWPQFLGTINRIASIEPEILDSARIMKLSQPVMIFRVLLPYIIPGVLSGLKVTMTTSVLMLNFAELMGATHGMGYYIQNSITYANYTHAVAGIIVIGIVVTILSAIVGFIQKKLIRWR